MPAARAPLDPIIGCPVVSTDKLLFFDAALGRAHATARARACARAHQLPRVLRLLPATWPRLLLLSPPLRRVALLLRRHKALLARVLGVRRLGRRRKGRDKLLLPRCRRAASTRHRASRLGASGGDTSFRPALSARWRLSCASGCVGRSHAAHAGDAAGDDAQVRAAQRGPRLHGERNGGRPCGCSRPPQRPSAKPPTQPTAGAGMVCRHDRSAAASSSRGVLARREQVLRAGDVACLRLRRVAAARGERASACL